MKKIPIKNSDVNLAEEAKYSLQPTGKTSFNQQNSLYNEDIPSDIGGSDNETASDASSTSADIAEDINPILIKKKRISPNETSSTTSSSSVSTSQSTSTLTMDPFEAEIKDIVHQYFVKQLQESSSSSYSFIPTLFRSLTFRQLTKTSWIRWIQLITLAILFIIGGIIPLIQGYWISLLITPTLGWLWMVNHWHDASHFALSSKWYINALFTYLSPWFSSPLIWYHQHVIGHHSYTNIPSADPDLYHAPKFWRFQTSLRFTKLHKYQEYTTPILWLLSVPTLLLIKPINTLLTKLYNRTVILQKISKGRIALHIFGRLLVFSSLYVWPWFMQDWSVFKKLCFSFIPIMIYSLWFMACSQVNHHTDETSEAFHPNWYRHQVMTSHNVAPQSSLTYWLSGGLNIQIEHHLFPFINQEHLYYLQPAIEAACKKHNVHYTKSNTISEAFIKLWDHLNLLSIPTPKSTNENDHTTNTKKNV